MEQNQQQPTREQINAQIQIDHVRNVQHFVNSFAVQTASVEFSPDAKAALFDILTGLASKFVPAE